MTEWVAEDFGPGKTGEQFQWLSGRLALHGHPLTSERVTVWQQTQAWQLANGYRGTALGQPADGYVGPTQLRQLKAAPYVPPALIRIDRSNWKITNPDASEVKQPAFETYENKPWFWEDENGEQVFRAPTSGGQTTSDATKYLRSETREQEGTSGAAWSSDDPHFLQLELAFTALPHVKQHAVGFQIHQGTGKVIMGRLEERKLFIESPFHDDVVLSTDYQLGTFFNVEIEPTKTGIIVVYNGKSFMLDGVTGENWFYKYGCYCQAYAGQKWNNQVVPKDSFAETRFRGAVLLAG